MNTFDLAMLMNKLTGDNGAHGIAVRCGSLLCVDCMATWIKLSAFYGR